MPDLGDGEVFDPISQGIAQAGVPLTTLRQPCHDISFAAMDAMLERLRNHDAPPKDILLDCEVVMRQSCGSDRSAASAVAAFQPAIR